eukprot:Rhum_TRINITY_DN13746_c2_g1::Rhum_TRINITY_DN13746_c2_g1_i1::g.63649::m.63649/K14416/HBS1; elongation factor 1 alpha-like protein
MGVGARGRERARWTRNPVIEPRKKAPLVAPSTFAKQAVLRGGERSSRRCSLAGASVVCVHVAPRRTGEEALRRVPGREAKVRPCCVHATHQDGLAVCQGEPCREHGLKLRRQRRVRAGKRHGRPAPHERRRLPKLPQGQHEGRRLRPHLLHALRHVDQHVDLLALRRRRRRARRKRGRGARGGVGGEVLRHGVRGARRGVPGAAHRPAPKPVGGVEVREHGPGHVRRQTPGEEAAAAAATAQVTSTETEAKTQQDSGGGRFALPSKKEARKVSVPVPAQAPSQSQSPSPSPSPSQSAATAAAAAAAAAGIKFEPAAKAEPRLARNASSTGSGASPPHSPKGRTAAVPAPVGARAAALASGGLSATPGLEHLQGWKPEAFSYPESGENSLNVVVVGHVDAGKSTLMGHLLYDLGCVPQRTIHKFEKESKAIGKASFHYAWVLDETAEERERGVTMDIATAFFSRGDRRITVLDAPGHAAFQGNTCLGATQADAAILVVNAVSGEFEAGIERGQTKEAIYILRGTGIANIIVAVNKLDTVGFSKTRYDAIVSRLTDFLLKTGFKESNLVFVPTSGLTGVNLVKKADPSADPDAAGLEWYADQAEAPTLAEALERLPVMPRWVDNVPLRLSVSDVMKSAVAGRVETGRIRVGDKIVIQPGNIQTTVKGLEKHQKGAVVGYAGDNVEVSLPSSVDTSQLAIGQAVSHTEQTVKLCQFFEAQILNVADGLPITKSYKCLFHIQSSVVEGTVSRMLPFNGKSSKIILPGRVGAVLVALANPVPVELASEFRGFGRVLLRASGTTVAMGPVTKVYPLAA